MGPENRSRHLEQRKNRYSVVLNVHGKEERINGTFREIQMLSVIDFATKKGERASEKDLRDLCGPQLNQDLRSLRRNLNSHGSEIITLGKRGAREFSLGEIPEQSTESFLAFRKSTKRQQPLKNISSNGKVNDIPEIFVLPEGEKYRQIAEIETDLAKTAISQLMDSLEKANHSPFELLQKVAPEGVSIKSLQGIWTKSELVEYIIECVIKTAEKVWNTENLALLSEKERQFLRNFTSLGKGGYDMERMVRVLRLLFSTPAPAPAAEARAN